MHYRKLGRSDLVVSEVGFGGWAISGEGWGPVDDETSVKAILKAIDLGVNFFDTADVYGNGHGEEVLGKALAQARGLGLVATKAGLRSPSGHDFSSQHIVEAVERSLRRLHVNHIDLLQLHNQNLEALNDEELWQTLHRLKREGWVRALGACVKRPADAFVAIEKGADAVQVVFNAIDQEARCLFDAARRENVGLIARVPLASGFLSGKYSEDHRFAPGDFRRRWSKGLRRETLRKGRVIGPVAEEIGASRSQAALAFVLSYNAVSVTIPGVKTPEQAEENTASSGKAPLPEELVRFLEEAHDRGFSEE